eukprot:c27157_g1_i2 orf=480-2354(-)
MEAVLDKIASLERELSFLKELVRAQAHSADKEKSFGNFEECTNGDWIQGFKSKLGPWTVRPLVVLSMFDGIGGIWAALSLLGIPYIGYSSEVNVAAIQLLRTRYPAVQHLGDARSIKKEHIKEHVDLIVGGFPCQDLSWLGKKVGLHGERSKLFFQLLRVIKLFKPKWFLAENVSSMHWVDRDEISKHLRCIPIEIDAQELTASKRKRFYWTNIRHPKFMPKIGDHWSTSLQSMLLENATAIEQKLGCILSANPLGSHVQLHHVVQENGNSLRYISITELEKVMGYPAGYTDIPFNVSSDVLQESVDLGNTGNRRGTSQVSRTPEKGSELTNKAQKAIRWQLLGNSFSVQVIAYLLSPLLDCHVRDKKRPPLVLPAKVKEEECFAMDVGEVWALYNTHQRPNWYGVIQNRSGDWFSPVQKDKPRQVLHIKVRFLEMAREYMSGEVDKWSPNRGAGRYRIGNVTDVQESWLAFSHRVTGLMKVQCGYFIYPHKGEVWALYDRQRRSCPWFVLVVESKIDKNSVESGKPGKEGFKAECRILQHTMQNEVFRVTDKVVHYHDLLQFSFTIPYYIKNHAGLLKLEFTNKGRKMLSEERKRKRKTGRGSDIEDDGETAFEYKMQKWTFS